MSSRVGVLTLFIVCKEGVRVGLGRHAIVCAPVEFFLSSLMF